MIRRKARRLWRWVIDPFVTKVAIHERSRIEYRLFPHKLRLQALPASLQEAVDACDGGYVSLEGGRSTYFVHDLDLTGFRGTFNTKASTIHCLGTLTVRGLS